MPQRPCADPVDAWVGLLAERLARGGVSAWWTQDVAAGMAASCAEAGRVLRDEDMDAWLAHALSSVGQADAAVRLAPPGRRPSPRALASEPLRLLARDGVLRVRRFPGTPPRQEWRLDLERLTRGVTCDELRICLLLREVAVRLCSAWSGRDGDGSVVTLSGLSLLARRMEGRRARADRVRWRTCWLQEYLRAFLRRMGAPSVPVRRADLTV